MHARSEDVLTLLKERTRHLHEHIEGTVDLPARLGSVATYSALLARFYGFYAPIEQGLAAVDGYETVGLDFAERRKTHLLRADLLALGVAAATIDRLPRCQALPAVSGLAAALGCLYVLEGATLGGQVIKREVKAKLGLAAGPTGGCAFFAAYADRTGAMWTAFRSTLSRFTAGSAMATEQVVAAAADTFIRLDAWLAEGAL